jgi:hypothetical protein
MVRWKHTVKIKHLLTENEDYDSVQKSMNNIADALQDEPCFHRFNFKKFRRIPKGDDVFGPVDYANKMISEMYNYADDNMIWVD